MKRLLALLLLPGCMATAQHTLIEQVANQQRCPEEKIEVMYFAPDWASAEVRACGYHSHYQKIVAGKGQVTWLDIGGIVGQK